MRILWSVNTIMPEAAKKLGEKSGHSISWVDAMSKRLAKNPDIDLVIVAPSQNQKCKKEEIDGITYYLIGCNASYVEWKWILDDFQPDVIHVYGTECMHNYSLIKEEKQIPIIISLQGILTEYERFYYGGIDVSTFWRFFCLKDLLAGGVFRQRRRFQRQAVNEREMLRSVKYVEGRTDWDRVATQEINPDLRYYHCPRLLRSAFYTQPKWNADEMVSHSIFVHQGTYPIKGLHFMLQALAILRKTYPDVHLYVAGNNILLCDTFGKRIRQSGYARYLKYLIKKMDLQRNITFTGRISAEQVAQWLTKCNVMVIPSAIENCPNSLAEAEVLGVPCVASYVGGNPEILRDGIDGFLYCYNEPGLLADKIRKIFDNRALAEKFSENARAFALERHDPDLLEKTLLGIYEDVLVRERRN